MNKRNCSNCKFCGFDIADGPFCVHPKVLEKHPYGLLLHNDMREFCPSPEHPLFEIKSRKE